MSGLWCTQTELCGDGDRRIRNLSFTLSQREQTGCELFLLSFPPQSLME
jgi:hypothetical protein